MKHRDISLACIIPQDPGLANNPDRPSPVATKRAADRGSLLVEAERRLCDLTQTSNAVAAALAYAQVGIFVLPCHARGVKRKEPIGELVPHGCRDATRDKSVIRGWPPDALIGGRTGLVFGFAVLDVDVKDPAANGFDTLAELGFAILPDTVLAHTPSGGVHIWFDPQGREIRNTEGARGRGIGPGLDWRGDGGYIILPSPGSGYWFDPHHPFGSALARVPVELLPREPKRSADAPPGRQEIGLSPYASAALDSACRRILAAPRGEQEATINAECFSIGTLAGAGGIPEGFALDVLLWAARQVPDYDTRHPWRPNDLELKVRRAFADGMRHPRSLCRA